MVTGEVLKKASLNFTFRWQSNILQGINSHNVYYEGEIKGTKLEGQWWLEDVPSIKGDWAMWPATSADIWVSERIQNSKNARYVSKHTSWRESICKRLYPVKHKFMCQKDKYGLRKMVQILVFFWSKNLRWVTVVENHATLWRLKTIDSHYKAVWIFHTELYQLKRNNNWK